MSDSRVKRERSAKRGLKVCALGGVPVPRRMRAVPVKGGKR